jgi:hypothetical protein
MGMCETLENMVWAAPELNSLEEITMALGHVAGTSLVPIDRWMDGSIKSAGLGKARELRLGRI